MAGRLLMAGRRVKPAPQLAVYSHPGGCHCPAEPGGPNRRGQAPEVMLAGGLSHLCPGMLAAIEPADGCEPHWSARLHYKNGGQEVALGSPVQLEAAWLQHGCPKWRLPGWPEQQQAQAA